MKARPMLFSAPMVRALLDGRKTQTRRILTVPWKGSRRAQPYEPYYVDDDGRLAFCDEYGDYLDYEESFASPYGEAGDQLWVKETWALSPQWDGVRPRDVPDTTPVRYVADDESWPGRRRPSIFMRRWMSRVALEITGVRVQRLQALTEADAIAEGLAAITKDGHTIKHGIPDRDGMPGTDDLGWPWVDWDVDPRKAYRRLWERINGAGSWEENPWIWAISFKRVTP